MNPRNIKTIFRKDLIDAIKDARVLMALIVPFGIAIFYNLTIDDEETIPAGTVAYTETGSELPDRLQEALDGTVRLTLESYDSPDAVSEAVGDEEATVGLVIPEGFDQVIGTEQTPELGLIIRESPSVAANIIATTIEDVVRDMAGIPQAATISVQQPAASSGNGVNVFDDLGPQRFFVLAALMMLIGMISVLAVPIILAEETEKKTLEALTLIASYLDVVAAKALVGVTYVVVGTGLVLFLTDSWPDDPVLFFSGVLLLGVALIGFGLLLGGLFKSANQLNTWGGLILIPVIAPAFITGIWSPGAFEYILEALPVTQGMKLAVNGMSGNAIFENVWFAYVVLLAWAVIAYTALVFRLSRLRA